MNPIKSIFLLMLFTFVSVIYSADSFQFDPQLYSTHIDTAHVYFVDKSTSEKSGPELYADETNTVFFNLVKTMINSSIAENKEIRLLYEQTNSQSHGQYKRIIPEF